FIYLISVFFGLSKLRIKSGFSIYKISCKNTYLNRYVYYNIWKRKNHLFFYKKQVVKQKEGAFYNPKLISLQFNYRENGEPSKLQHPVNGKLTTTAGTTSELHKDVYIISPKSSFLPVGIFFFSCMLIKYKGAFFMLHASGCYLSYQLKFILSQRQ
ncbi:MAG: hypothetical protein ACI4VX_07585, partial [Succinivibrionaceae bacterium]